MQEVGATQGAVAEVGAVGRGSSTSPFTGLYGGGDEVGRGSVLIRDPQLASVKIHLDLALLRTHRSSEYSSVQQARGSPHEHS